MNEVEWYESTKFSDKLDASYSHQSKQNEYDGSSYKWEEICFEVHFEVFVRGRDYTGVAIIKSERYEVGQDVNSSPNEYSKGNDNVKHGGLCEWENLQRKGRTLLFVKLDVFFFVKNTNLIYIVE